MNKAIAGSAGYGVGNAVIISNEIPEYDDEPRLDVEQEKERLSKGIESFIDITNTMAQSMEQSVGENNSAILKGHILMLNDPYMQDEMMNRIDGGMSAEKAVYEACESFIQVFSSTGDELIAQRTTDLKDIRVRLIKILTGTPDINISQVPEGTVIVAKDLTPSMTAGIVKENVEGIVTEVGGVTSHSAILARALEIPAVLSVENITKLVKNGDVIAVDGCDGVIEINPDDEVASDYEQKKDVYNRDKELLKNYIGRKTETKDGLSYELYANIGKPEDVTKAIEADAEGIGLFRTEFLFMDRDKMPTEEEQYQAYKQVLEAMDGKEVIIRTLDIGGDKDIPYMEQDKEENPFLGYRAVRYCLGYKDIFKTQLRALLRAGAHGNLGIMIPLVTTVDEIRQVKGLISDIKNELKADNMDYSENIRIGVMIETPAASEIADLLANEVDFFSIGTNDLTQYTLAIDRQNMKLDTFYDAHHPAVLRMIQMTIENGHKHGCWVGICGELGADMTLTKTFIEMGIDELSVSPSFVLPIRKIIREM